MRTSLSRGDPEIQHNAAARQPRSMMMHGIHLQSLHPDGEGMSRAKRECTKGIDVYTIDGSFSLCGAVRPAAGSVIGSWF